MLATICIPTFNRASYFDLALESCRAQDFEDLEILVLDDASTDATAEVAQRHVDEDPRVIYVRQPQNVGFIANWNTGLERARGTFVKVIGDDDVLRPDALRVAIDAFGSAPSSVGLVCTDYDTIDENGVTVDELRGSFRLFRADHFLRGTDVIAGYLLRRLRIGMPTAMTFRRELASSVGPFDPGAGCMADIDYWARLCEVADFQYVDHVTCSQRRHSGNLSSALEREPTYFADLQRLHEGLLSRLDEDTKRRVNDRARLLACVTMTRFARHARELPRDQFLDAIDSMRSPIRSRVLRLLAGTAARVAT